MTPLHQRLRRETAAAHDRLERLMALDDEGLTLGRYGAALQVLHAVRAGWEPGIEALVPGSAGPHLGWLEADLVHLGLPVLAAAPGLALGGAAEAWGARYVLEGSALGGRMLLRRVAGLGVSGEVGARYFAGHGEGTGAVWRGFLGRLEGQAGEAERVVAGARLAFDGLARCSERLELV